ncbi:MAG TPA: type II toxin-antitoxin system death-on-curing family toxin, partial [Spirochaeta sp.]|nr:type II toxin-antitoxin system death-on-curing family toxin [Spirochaeta sp.]
ITQNHPFLDGNKRTGLAAGLVFLELNGIHIEDSEESLYEMVINVTLGKFLKKDIASALRKLHQNN